MVLIPYFFYFLISLYGDTMKRYYTFITVFFVLILIGLVMIYSSSMIWAEYKTGNQFYYLIRQAIFLFIGTIVFFITQKIPLSLYKKYSNHLFIFSIILLILVLMPGIGSVRGGARSWIGFKEFSIQPAELVKITSIIFTSKVLANNPKMMSNNKDFYLYLLIIIFVFGLILLQPDFGTGAVLTLSLLFMLFIGGVQMKNIILGGILAVIGVALMIIMAPYRMERIISFLDPWSDPLGSGFQIIQSLYAISPAGLFGYGLFNSRQKYYYLPEPQNDFIFSILVEELGIIGGTLVILLFFYLIFTGYKIAKYSKDSFSSYLAFGFSSLLFIQVFINISVVIGLIPVTGVTLPFISYGGSSLIISMFMMGIMVNIMKNTDKDLDFEYKYKKIKLRRTK